VLFNSRVCLVTHSIYTCPACSASWHALMHNAINCCITCIMHHSWKIVLCTERHNAHCRAKKCEAVSRYVFQHYGILWIIAFSSITHFISFLNIFIDSVHYMTIQYSSPVDSSCGSTFQRGTLSSSSGGWGGGWNWTQAGRGSLSSALTSRLRGPLISNTFHVYTI
jgi:hypothetical protein